MDSIKIGDRVNYIDYDLITKPAIITQVHSPDCIDCVHVNADGTYYNNTSVNPSPGIGEAGFVI